jgi:hypothetical protein
MAWRREMTHPLHLIRTALPLQEKAWDFSRGYCHLKEPARSQESTNTNMTQIFPMPQLQDQFTLILDSFDMRWHWAR